MKNLSFRVESLRFEGEEETTFPFRNSSLTRRRV